MNRQRKWCLGVTLLVLLMVGVAAIVAPRKVAKCGLKFKEMCRQVDVVLNLADIVEVDSPLLRACNRHEKGLNDPELWIAHGGGGHYLNSLEAVQESIRRGFRYVELDLLTTTDGYLVGGHDWAKVRQSAGFEDISEKAVSKQELLAARPNWEQTLLFAADICRLMEENPHIILVTDKVQDFELLMREIPYPDRMVVEAFDLYNYLCALRSGFRNAAYSVASIDGLLQARRYNIRGMVLSSALMVNDSRALKLVKLMHQEGCCFLVCGVEFCDNPLFIH